MIRFTIPRNAQRRSTGVVVAVLLSLLSACSSDAPVEAPHRASPIPAATGPSADQRAGQDLAALAASLDRELARDPKGSRVVTSFRTSDGETGSTTVRELRNQVRQLSKPLSPTAFGIPSDGSPLLQIINPSSTVIASGNKFSFYSLTPVNKLDPVNFVHVGARTVATMGDNKVAGQAFWSQTDSLTIWSLAGGFLPNEWATFTITSGCAFKATLATTHHAAWPGGLTPSGIVQHAKAYSGGSADMTHTCPPSPPPPPVVYADSSNCEDASVAGCGAPTSGTGFGYSGPVPATRGYGTTAEYKVVCLVTDWYENGVYVETVIDRCWRELA